MENKRKKTIILISIIIILVVVVACILIFTKPNKKQNNPTNDPTQSEENNKPNNDKDNIDDDNSADKDSDDKDNQEDNNSNDNNENPSNPGDNNQGGTTPAPKKLRIYSCRKTVQENGIEIADSLNLTYHIENGLQSDEVIVTIKAINGTGTNYINSVINFYKNWFNQLNSIKGIAVTTTQSGDKTIFRIRTDYTKVDYSNIDFEDENRLRFYNDIRATDSLEVITRFLDKAGYTCQPPKEA